MAQVRGRFGGGMLAAGLFAVVMAVVGTPAVAEDVDPRAQRGIGRGLEDGRARIEPLPASPPAQVAERRQAALGEHPLDQRQRRRVELEQCEQRLIP